MGAVLTVAARSEAAGRSCEAAERSCYMVQQGSAGTGGRGARTGSGLRCPAWGAARCRNGGERATVAGERGGRLSGAGGARERVPLGRAPLSPGRGAGGARERAPLDRGRTRDRDGRVGNGDFFVI